eukprot:1240089-Amphidinium_carterae.1
MLMVARGRTFPPVGVQQNVRMHNRLVSSLLLHLTQSNKENQDCCNGIEGGSHKLQQLGM